MDRRVVICAFGIAAFLGAKIATAQAPTTRASHSGERLVGSGFAESTVGDQADGAAANIPSAQAPTPPASHRDARLYGSGFVGSTFGNQAEGAAAKISSAQPATPAVSSGGWRFMGTGFVGSMFGDEAEGAAFDLGGAFTWRTHRHFGVEAIGSFTPSATVLTGELEDSRLGDFMFNAMTGARVGGWYPYVTGGVGLINFHSEALGDVPPAVESRRRLG